MSIGPFEILLFLAVLTIIVGPRRITNMARSLGRGAQDFVSEFGEKKAVGKGDDDTEDEDQKTLKTPDER